MPPVDAARAMSCDVFTKPMEAVFGPMGRRRVALVVGPNQEMVEPRRGV